MKQADFEAFKQRLEALEKSVAALEEKIMRYLHKLAAWGGRPLDAK